jgi:hypothetical protein
MTTIINTTNAAPYLRTAREFPEDLRLLVFEVNKTYVDIANAVNNRTISIFPTTKPAITGESWFITANIRQQSFRQVYTFTSTASINHGINTSLIDRFTAKYGDFTDGTNFYGLIAATTTAIAGQISFYLSSTQIIFETGAGAPSLTSGNIVLEWLAKSNQQTTRD